MVKIIDGKAVSKAIKDEVKQKVEELQAKGITVTLAVIQVGNNQASTVYVNNKKKACEYTGIRSLAYELPEETTQEELLDLVEELNARADVMVFWFSFRFLPIWMKTRLYARFPRRRMWMDSIPKAWAHCASASPDLYPVRPQGLSTSEAFGY